MKKLIVVLVLACYIFLCMPHVSNNNSLENQQVTVVFEYVNFRSNHNTNSRILDTVDYGTTARLTGKVCDYWLDDFNTRWYEVVINGEYGWLTARAVRL